MGILISGTPRKWWDAETARRFEDRGRCMVEQYNRFYSPMANKTVDGQRSLGENIADNGGAAEAYRAYSKSRVLVLGYKGNLNLRRFPMFLYVEAL